MADFRSEKRSAPNYLGRREQRGLLGLVFLLGAVLYLMSEAARPENWHWFVALGQEAPNAEPTRELAAVDIDTRLAGPGSEVLQPGEFRSPAPPAQQPAAGERRYFPGVKPELLDVVRDDTLFLQKEREACFHLFKILARTDPAALRQAARPVAFVQLFRQSAAYRGEVVAMRGTVRRTFYIPAERKADGIEGYHQVWLQPEDHPSSPVVAYVLELPPGFPTGMNVREEVELTGFYFKRWAYGAGDGIRTAPLILARQVQWEAPEPGPSATGVSWWPVVGVALAFAIVVATFVFTRGRPTPAYLAWKQKGPQEPLAAVDEESLAPTAGQFLKQLETGPESSPPQG